MHSFFLVCFGLFVLFLTLVNSSEISTKLPSILTEEALQWLTLPSRWRSQHLAELSSNDIDRLLQQFEQINENGIPQTDLFSIEGVSMEVFYEVNRLTRRTR